MKTKSNVFEKCHDIFQQEVFSLEGIPNTYKIQEAFMKKGDSADPCFGCSMRDCLFLITNYLKKQVGLTITKDNLLEYFLLQNLLVDRMETMLDILKIDTHFRQKEFKVFQEIRQWTYFLKLNQKKKGFDSEQKNTMFTSFLPINIIELTTRFCVAINKFIALMCESLDKIKDKSSLTPQYFPKKTKKGSPYVELPLTKLV
jgi:hypothetical protein